MFVSGKENYYSSLVLNFKTNEGCSNSPEWWPADSGTYTTIGVGGMLGNISVFCASTKWRFQRDKYNDLWDGCMLWKNGTWHRGPNMLTHRTIGPAGIIMQNKVWYTGGFTCTEYVYRNLAPTDKYGYEYRARENCSTVLKSTELISLESTVPFVDLPKPLVKHCIIKINEDLAMVTGGRAVSDEDKTRFESHFEKNTHFFSFSHQRWIPGPDLLLGRQDHACGTFLMGDETIMVVAGGLKVVEVDDEFHEREQHKTDSVEFLSLQNIDKGWFKGKIQAQEKLFHICTYNVLNCRSEVATPYGTFSHANKSKWQRIDHHWR